MQGEFSTISMRTLTKTSVALLFWVVLCLGYGWSQPTSKPKHDSGRSEASRKTSRPGRMHASSRKGKRSKKASWRLGQQKMDSDRARQVQEALIREHYLTGEPNGIWDQRSEDAMIRFQATNGWQTKIVPDSRALIKLGLGPNQDHLLNPESAMTSPLEPTSTSEHIAPAGAGEHTAPSGTQIAPTSPGRADPVSSPQD